mgnify:CR=1 FL=1
MDILLTLQYEKPFDRLHRIHQLDSSEIRSSGYVVDTLEAALRAISYVEKKEKNEEQIRRISKDYANDVLTAVNLGEDTDTVGAVAGGLAAIIHGLGYKGEQWLERLRNKELILECLW